MWPFPSLTRPWSRTHSAHSPVSTSLALAESLSLFRAVKRIRVPVKKTDKKTQQWPWWSRKWWLPGNFLAVQWLRTHALPPLGARVWPLIGELRFYDSACRTALPNGKKKKASKGKERSQNKTRRNLKCDTAHAKATFCSKSSKAFAASSWLCHLVTLNKLVKPLGFRSIKYKQGWALSWQSWVVAKVKWDDLHKALCELVTHIILYSPSKQTTPKWHI